MNELQVWNIFARQEQSKLVIRLVGCYKFFRKERNKSWTTKRMSPKH